MKPGGATPPLWRSLRETRHLRIVRSQLEDRAGVIGAAVMVIEHVLSPATIDAAIAAAPPDRRAFALR